MPKAPKGFNILYVFADLKHEWNCSQWRMLSPSDAINRYAEAHPDEGWSAKLMHWTGFVASIPGPNYQRAMQKWPGRADLIIFQRNVIREECINAIDYWRFMGKAVVIDLDDEYKSLPYSNPARRFWFENEEIVAAGQDEPDPNHHINLLTEGVRRSNGLIAPNRNLLEAWAAETRGHGYYLQNYAERGWWVDLPERAALKAEQGLTDKVVIGWGGSMSHYDSFVGSGVLEAARRLTIKHPNLLWLICGGDTRPLKLLDVPAHNKAHQQGVPPSDWPKIVKMFDIGIAPLSGWYDQNRSWIKGIEYSLAGVPWVGTQGGRNGTYSDIQGPLIFNGVEQWESALGNLIVNLEAAQAQANALIPHAQQQFIADNNIEVYRRVYGKIIQDAAEQNRATVSMLPGVTHVKAQAQQNGAEQTAQPENSSTAEPA